MNEQGIIGWGIVGTGTIADQFASDMALVPGSHITAICSRSIGSARAFAQRHCATASAFDSLEAFLSDGEIEVVYVATPNHTHFDIALSALKAGKAVLVEKPLVMSSRQLEQLRVAAEKHGSFLMEGLWTHFLPAIEHVRELLATGSLGEIKRIDADLAFHHPFDPDSRFYDKAKGGGALRDLGIYPLSITVGLFGQPDNIVGQWNAASTGVDLSASIDMKFNKMKARLTCAIDRQGSNVFCIEGTKSALVIQAPFIAARSVLHCKNRMWTSLATNRSRTLLARLIKKVLTHFPLPGIDRTVIDFPGSGLQFEIEAVAEALRNGQTQHPLVSVNHSLAVMQIIETLLEAPPGGTSDQPIVRGSEKAKDDFGV